MNKLCNNFNEKSTVKPQAVWFCCIFRMWYYQRLWLGGNNFCHKGNM